MTIPQLDGHPVATLDQAWAHVREMVRPIQSELRDVIESLSENSQCLHRWPDEALRLVGFVAAVALAEALHRLEEQRDG